MMGMTVVFHIMSAAVGALLVFWVLRLQSERDFLRAAWKRLTGESKRVVVSEPGKYLARFAAALSIPFSDERRGRQEAVKILDEAFLTVMLNYRVESIACRTEEGRSICSFSFGKPIDDTVLQRLQTALGSAYDIRCES